LQASLIIFFKALLGLHEKNMNDTKQSRQSSLYLMEENEGRLVYQASTGGDETEE
jgi:hypothetical protein